MVWVHSWKTLLFLYLLVLGTTSYSLLILGHSGRAAAFLGCEKRRFFKGDRMFFWFVYARGRRAVFRTASIGSKFVDTAENWSKQVCLCFLNGKVRCWIIIISIIIIYWGKVTRIVWAIRASPVFKPSQTLMTPCQNFAFSLYFKVEIVQIKWPGVGGGVLPRRLIVDSSSYIVQFQS